MSLQSLKNKSTISSIAEKINESLEGKQKGSRDDRFWTLTIDEAKNGSAEIRFLPPVESENLPYIEYWDYSFRGPGGNYWEKSLSTIGQLDPVAEYNSKLWNDNSGTQADIEARQNDCKKRRRRANFVANIYVVNDPAHPENNGGVFLYRFGKQIMTKIKEAISPEFPDEEPIDVFNLWTGANLKLHCFNKAGFPNLEKSKFARPSALLGGNDEALEEVYSKVYPLQPLVAPDQFGTYDELKAKLYRALQLDVNGNPVLRKEAGFGNAVDDDVEIDEETSQNALEYFKQMAAKAEKASASEIIDDDVPF